MAKMKVKGGHMVGILPADKTEEKKPKKPSGGKKPDADKQSEQGQ